MLRVVIVFSLLSLCACSGAFGERYHKAFHSEFQSGATPPIHIDNIAGSVEIEPWSKPVIDIDATKYGYDADEVNRIKIAVRVDAVGNVFVATQYSGTTHNGGVRYHIRVPSGAALHIENVAGTVSVGAVTGNLIVETQAGTIDASVGRVEGDRLIDLSATTGTITLKIARDSSATVDAQSTVGGFSSDFPSVTETRQNIVGSRASGKIGAGAARIRLATDTGAIDLKQE